MTNPVASKGEASLTSVLVTGGAGFIGSHLVESLLARGYEAAVLDNFSTGTLGNLQLARPRTRLRIIKGDITKKDDVKGAVQQADAIIHLAALTSLRFSQQNPALVFKVNTQGTNNLLTQAARVGSQKFILASSTAVYGNTENLPAKETQPLNPLSPYAASKVRAEELCASFRRTLGLDTVVLRYFNVYGPRQSRGPYSSVITKFIEAARKAIPLTIFGDGRQTRDFIHVTDVVAATVRALESRDSASETFNVATGVPTTVNELANTIVKMVRSNSTIRHAKARAGEIRFSYGDTSKAKERLGFVAQVSLTKGLEGLLAGSISNDGNDASTYNPT